MEGTRVAMLGVGSMRAAPPIIATLASYFGERPLAVRLFDADEERVELIDRLARICFAVGEAKHEVTSFTKVEEAVEEVENVILMVGVNCAVKMLKQAGAAIPPPDLEDPNDNIRMIYSRSARAELLKLALEPVISNMPDGTYILNLMRDYDPSEQNSKLEVRTEQWFPELGRDERRAAPFQVLRWLRGEEFLAEFLTANERSPLKAWLDNPASPDSA